jgi:hypothetical protein
MRERGGWSNTGPVPVRDLLRQSEAAPETRSSAAEVVEHGFTADGEAWLARAAGEGCYGTGRRGVARLMAVHFFRVEAADEPVLEALVPAAAFGELGEREWVEVWSGATPIEPAR